VADETYGHHQTVSAGDVMTNKTSFDNFVAPYLLISIFIFLLGVALYFVAI
jgi:hypothetical protein